MRAAAGFASRMMCVCLSMIMIPVRTESKTAFSRFSTSRCLSSARFREVISRASPRKPAGRPFLSRINETDMAMGTRDPSLRMSS